MNGTPNETEDPRGGCGLDVAAYALGALDPPEAKAFADHLKTCTMCREELTEFEAVVSALPMTVRQHAAPEGLRRRVMDVVRDEARAGSGAGAGASARRLGRPSWLALPRPAMALGAVVAVVAVAVAGILNVGSGGPRRTTVHTRVYAAQVSGIGGSAEVKVTGDRGELIVRNLDPPPAGKIYEVWLARPHQRLQPAGTLFSVSLEGNDDVGVPGSLRGVTGVMVTPEPAGGSPHPTHAPVIRAQLT